MKTLTANTALTHTNATNTIPSNNNSQAAPLPVNTWGYNLDATSSYLPIPSLTTEATLATTSAPSASSQTAITIGAKTNTTTMAGTYSNTLQFTAVSNYVPPPPAIPMQTITSSNCPRTRTKAYDVRDNATYWVQKLADNKCWMLTNLAYGGGGDNTYNDVKAIQQYSSGSIIYTPAYYVPTNANKTTNPQDPSISTDGGATNPQYGYIYNWCGAMGGQTTTSACANATTPLPDTNTSICPSGWRLPTGGTGGEYEVLNTAINGGNTTSSTGLQSTWLGMLSGVWSEGWWYQGQTGFYWSSTQNPSNSRTAFALRFSQNVADPSTRSQSKDLSVCAVRCLAL